LEALVREVREKTGLEVELGRLIGVYAKRRARDLVFVLPPPRNAESYAPPTNVIGSSSSIRARCPTRPATMDRDRIADALKGCAELAVAVQPSQGENPPAGTR
jgi:hypothetical protein